MMRAMCASALGLSTLAFLVGCTRPYLRPGDPRDVVEAIKRAQFIEECRRPLRLTWSQLGRISREGQTDAGQRAELDIANAIADTAFELCKLTDQELFNVFKEH